ncbi:MAG TPA: S8 family serine peptidase [Candidatus Paceibacterota bacterium]|jgi:subtilisin family serine protease
MLRRSLPLILALTLLGSPLLTLAKEAHPQPKGVIVKFVASEIDLADSEGKAKAHRFAESNGLTVKRLHKHANLALLETSQPAHAAALLKKDPSVVFAEPNYAYTLDETVTNPTDSRWNLLWGMQNRGQVVNGVTGLPDADVDAQEAWQLSKGSGVIVAVIDTGVYYTHPELAGNMWDGANCVDEAGQPLGGCVHGYDFPRNSTDPKPAHSHGTHVAGTIAALADNGTGIAGVAPEAQIMALRTDTVDQNGLSLYTEDIIRAIDFARENGATVINASFGGPDNSLAMRDAIARFGEAGGVFVASAGNAGRDIDTEPTFPAAYDLPNIITVAATDSQDSLASFSNTGAVSVDVAAPGVHIVSTMGYPLLQEANSPEASPTPSSDKAYMEPAEIEDDALFGYDYMSGTSMAAPHVSGIVALLAAYKPSLSATAFKGAVLSGGDSLGSHDGRTLTGKRVNAFGALASVADASVTGTVTLAAHVKNDNGGAATLPGFTYKVDGSAPRSFASATTTLTLAPGTYTIAGVTKAGYAVSAACTGIALAVDDVRTCLITFDDGPTDTTPPVIVLKGANPQTLPLGQAYVELGATATDAVDGALASSSITINSSSVNMNVVGTYAVTYTATDAAGNKATATRSVIVKDMTAPVLTLTGANPLYLKAGQTYVEPGATARDAVDGAVAVTITGTVNTKVVGTYVRTYTATDKAGNKATLTRSVVVTKK